MQLMEFLKAYTDYAIFGVLALMSFMMVYAAIERAIFYLSLKVANYNTVYELEIEMRKNLSIIYSTGAVAPYVGLLGTVIGILITFFDMGQAGASMEATQIMLGLALALKATAAGILVAIPAVMIYNHYQSRVDTGKLAWQALQEKSLLSCQRGLDAKV
ncbi:MAG: TonB-system energizer ExbB [Pelistega sp.]|nr:TonB-system energizer ExbB [Pelistega sp.]